MMSETNPNLIYAEPVLVIDTRCMVCPHKFNLGIGISRGDILEQVTVPAFNGYIYQLNMKWVEHDGDYHHLTGMECTATDEDAFDGLLLKYLDVIMGTGEDVDNFIKYIANSLSKFVSANAKIDDDRDELFAYELIDTIHVVSRILATLPTDYYNETMEKISSRPVVALLKHSRKSSSTGEEIPCLPEWIDFTPLEDCDDGVVYGEDYDSAIAIKKRMTIS